MGRNASVSLDFGDDTYEFRFPLGQQVELEEKTGVSCFKVLARMLAYEPMANDRREVIRLGLIGGGMKPTEALRLVRTYCDEQPPAETLPTAIAILQAGLMGVPDEDPGKISGGAGATGVPDDRLKIGQFYRTGAAMGFTPQQVDAMSLWQFQAAVAGWAEANGGEVEGGLTQDEFERASAALDAAPDVMT